MNTLPPQSPRKLETTILSGILVACLAFRFYFIFQSDINWDEFYYLSNIYDYQRQELTNSFQSLHVHLFGWLKYVSQNEVRQVVVARLIMFALSLLTTYFLFAICRKFTLFTASLFAVTAYCGFTFVLEHAASFRTDPIATCLLMGAIYLIVIHRKHYLSFCGAGLLIGIAGMITIKSVFFLPTITTILLASWLGGEEKKTRFFEGLVTGFSAIFAFGILYVLHSNGLPQASAPENSTIISNSVEKTLLSSGLFPQWEILIHAVSSNIIAVAALIAGSIFVLKIAFNRNSTTALIDRKTAIVLLSFLFPLTTLVFYRNTFPYFYPFILASASVLLAVFADQISEIRDRYPQHSLIAVILLAFMAFQAGVGIWKNLQRTSQTQIATLEVIHKLFPEPVAYIDRNSMVSSFPKKGFFMSSWGFENYYTNGKPIMREILVKDQPKFIIANIEALDFDLPNNGPKLFAEDEDVLRQNFLHYWGKIYLPGKIFKTLGGEPGQNFEILIEGNYTLEAAKSLALNGRQISPGDKVFLNQGYHTLNAANSVDTAILHWGDNLHMPEMKSSDAPIFFGF